MRTKEEIKEYQRAYYEAHKKTPGPVRKKKNLEEIRKHQREYQKKYWDEHKEEIKEYRKKYRKENKEKVSNYRKKYYKENGK